MNKAELVKKVSETTGFPQTQTSAILGEFLKTIEQVVSDGDSVNIIGFGTFEAAQRSERQGRNPKTGETIHIKAARVPRFKPGKGFKEAVK